MTATLGPRNPRAGSPRSDGSRAGDPRAGSSEAKNPRVGDPLKGWRPYSWQKILISGNSVSYASVTSFGPGHSGDLLDARIEQCNSVIKTEYIVPICTCALTRASASVEETIEKRIYLYAHFVDTHKYTGRMG